MIHSRLIGKSDEELRELAPHATHQHYKGGLYRLIGFGKHTETGEELAFYEHLYPYNQAYYARPYEMFNDNARFRPLCHEF